MPTSSIRRDLSIRIGLIILFVNLLVGVVYNAYSTRYAYKEFNSYTNQLTDNIADVLSSQLWLVDVNATKEICNLVLDTSYLQGLKLRDHHKGIIFNSGFTANHRTIHLERELRYEDVLLGFLDVYFSNRELAFFRRPGFVAGLLMVCGTVLASFFALNQLLIRYLSLPLQTLQDDMAKMAGGSFPQSKMKKQKLEVQNIIDAFNDLALKLQKREQEVKEKTNSLTREVQERRKTAELLRLSQENWERTFNAMKDIVIIFDGALRIVQANMATYSILSLSREDVVGLQCNKLFADEDFQWKECTDRIRTNNLSHENKVFTHTPTGKIYNSTVVPVHDNKAGIAKFVFTAADITFQKELEAELLQAQKMETIGTLAGGIAHDFNNILTAIIGFSEIALTTDESFEDTKRYINKALDGSYRARELVKQILTFGRKGDQVRQLLDPAKILHEALGLMRASVPSTITIRKDISEVVGVIKADATRIHQVIVNLCTNGVQAMEEEQGELFIGLQETTLEQDELAGFPEAFPGRFVQVTVSDTGTGMDQDQVARIFEPYYTTKDVGKGSGLGLALVHAIVVDCGGLVRVKSSPGKGSTFNVYFPLTEEIPNAKCSVQAKKIPGGHGEHLLVIDDEKAIVELLKTALERNGYSVTTCLTGEEALGLLSSAPDEYDLLITDQTMPKCTGLELAGQALKIKPDLPVMLCTGYSTRVSPETLRNVGVRGFAMKPISTATLMEKVHNLLHP